MKYQVWYMRPEYFADGYNMPNIAKIYNLEQSHKYLLDLEANSLEEIWCKMQAEVWSPNGEARPLIRAKGLHHTSMSVGDIVVDRHSNVYVAKMFGFKLMGVRNRNA